MPVRSALDKACDVIMAGIRSTALCPSRDADLLSAFCLDAMERDDESRGLGIRRQAWGFDTFPRQQMDGLFRFEQDEIEYLMEELDFPRHWITPSGSHFTDIEAMLWYLRRLSYPSKLSNLTNEGFSAQIGALSELYGMVGDWMFENHSSRLLQTGLGMWAHRVPEYAERVEKYTGIAGLDCFGFVDGTSRPIARPGYFQRAFYSGHKRNHCLQFLSVTAPDGMILYTAGPTNGAHQDNHLVHESGLVTNMLPDLERRLGKTYCIYGDPIFAQSVYLQRGYPRVEITWEQLLLNRAMNSARVSIEHVFGTVTNTWCFVDFNKTHRLHGTQPARAYLNAQFLVNCRNCLRPNQISQRFDCEPPTLHEYLHDMHE